MKKILFLGFTLVAGLMSCTKDYTDWTKPQSNTGNEPTQTLAMTVQPTVSAIDFATETSEKIQLFTTNLTQGQADDYTVDLTPAGTDAEPITLLADASGYVSTSELSNAVATLFGKAPVERTLSVMVSTIATASTPDGNVKVRRVGTPYALKAKLDVPVIASAYYLIGGPNDWQGSAVNRSIKFSHSGKDVYEDPVFTVVFDAAASGDTWFAIGDDKACDAIANNDWSLLYGIVGGDNEAKEGKLARRSEMGGAENSFKVAAGAKKIRVTINMLESTFKVEAVNIADAYYIIGGNGSWNSDKSQKFSHSDRDVFEDPVFTYVLTGGSELWFAFGEAEALDATDNGDWNQLYGYVGEQGTTGSYDRRSALGGEFTFHLDGAAKFYRFSINVLTKTYEITPLNFDPFIYYIGATDGWANAEQKLALTDESGIYTGFLYCADPNGWGNEFKFQKVPGNWDSQLNSGSFSGGITGDFADGGDNIKATAGEGVYFVTLDMGNMTLNAVKVQKMGLIGDFNGWGGDVEMTWNANDYCFEATGAGVTANGWKFRINADWAINLGSNDGVEPSTVLNDLVANGKNIGVAGSTVKLYPTRKTSDKIYCTVE